MRTLYQGGQIRQRRRPRGTPPLSIVRLSRRRFCFGLARREQRGSRSVAPFVDARSYCGFFAAASIFAR